MDKLIIGYKKGMTRMWDSNIVSPITIVHIMQAYISEIVDYVHCVNIKVCYGNIKQSKLSKPVNGYFIKNKLESTKNIREFRVAKDHKFKVGQVLGVEQFKIGEYISVQGVTKGKGFAGAMKRHGFHGLGASHGTEKTHRSPGSIGMCATPGHVFKGRKMPGRMGNDKLTIHNLKIRDIDKDNNILYISNPVPGADNNILYIVNSLKKATMVKV